MTLNRKYAALPDLDSAPDTYETPELTDDASTVPASTFRSTSPDENLRGQEDGEEDEDDDLNIDRRRLRPDEARSQFSPALVDARQVDFSDRISAKRKSYAASTRRRRRGEELGDLSDEEDESTERKLARLRREVEELKSEVEQKKLEREKAGESGENEASLDEQSGGVNALSDVLESLHMANNKASSSAAQLAKQLSRPLNSGSKKSSGLEHPPSSITSNKSATYTVTYSPSYQETHALAKAADFETRLTALERVLGITSSAYTTFSEARIPRAILTTLDSLDRQLNTLSQASPASLESISRRVRLLASEADKLDESRRSTYTDDDISLSNYRDEGEKQPRQAQDGGSSDQISKINALYGTLPTIESLAPLLPAVLERLRSLRVVHAEAGSAKEGLDMLEKRQQEMKSDIAMWRDGLEKLEKSMKEGEGVTLQNMTTVEGWVTDLEERVAKLDQGSS